jgi:hypothetical protein
MAVSTSPFPTPNDSAGHVYLRVEESRGQDAPFLFEQTHQRMGRAVVASFASHAAVFLLALFVIRYAPRPPITEALLPYQPNSQIAWLSQPGPAGGPGGGGNRMQAPPRQAEELGKDSSENEAWDVR